MSTRPHLFTGERVLQIRDVDTTVPERISPLEALCRLCGVDSETSIGDNGPVIAARAARSEASGELRLFEVVFGRDALVAALLLAERYPKLLRATVVRLAELQGVTERPAAEEEPGRIVHEARVPDDPIAQKISASAGWEWPYYGSVDATPLFVIACSALEQSSPEALHASIVGRDGATTSLARSCANALSWIGRRIKSSPAHLLETQPTLHGGLTNQAWKDSWDAYFHADGTIAVAPLSSPEVQGFAYDALAFVPELAARYPDVVSASEARTLGTLRESLLSGFRSVYVLDRPGEPPIAAGADYAPDATSRPLRVGASNMGHLLSSSLLDDIEIDGLAMRVVEYLFSPDLLGGAGVRTVATSAARYRESAYHNGSVWLWENAAFALALRNRGLHDHAGLLGALVETVCRRFGAFPEFARGGKDISFNTRVVDVEDATGRRNRIEQPPQQIQAWTVAGVIALQSEGLIRGEVADPL